MDKAMNNNQLKSLYLFNVLHRIPKPLESAISIKLTEFNHEKAIKYPDSWEDGTRICNNCGMVFIPGLNVAISIGEGMNYKCLKCNKVLTIKINSPPASDNEVVKKQNIDNKVDDGKINKNKAKERKKKRNQSLQSLLDQKKKSSPSLDLMEFMN